MQSSSRWTTGFVGNGDIHAIILSYLGAVVTLELYDIRGLLCHPSILQQINPTLFFVSLLSSIRTNPA